MRHAAASVRSAKKKPARTAGVRATVAVTTWPQRDRRGTPPRCGVRARAAGRRAFHRKAATATANDATSAASAVRASGGGAGLRPVEERRRPIFVRLDARRQRLRRESTTTRPASTWCRPTNHIGGLAAARQSAAAGTMRRRRVPSSPA